MTFAHPYLLLLLLLLPVLAWLRGRRGQRPAFLYSSVQLVRGITGVTRSRAGVILVRLRWLVLALFIVGLIVNLASGQVSIRFGARGLRLAGFMAI